ncbi:MAG: hypothetical protein ACLFST_06055 [Spirochaetia bacterium]
MKRLVMLLLVTVIVTGGLFANGESEEGAMAGRPSLSIWVDQAPPPVALDETPGGKLLEEALGADIEWEYTVGEASQAAGIILASGDYPDAVACGNKEINMFVNAGVYTDLTDYMKNSPMLDRYYPQSYLDAHYANESGEVPWLSNGVPGPPSLNFPGGGWFIQQEVLEFGGYPEYLNFDEYIELLRDYAEANPEINGHKTYAWIFQNNTWQFDTLTNPTAELYGYIGSKGIKFEMVDGKWDVSIQLATDQEKYFLKKLNELFVDGLLDQESFVHNQEQYQAKLAQGNYLGGYGYSYQHGPPENALREQGMGMHRWVGVPVSYEEDITPTYRVTGSAGINGGFAIMPDTEDPDLVWDVFVERWLSDDAISARWWKIPGETYSIADDGTYYMTEAQMEDYYSKTIREDYMVGRVSGGRWLPYASGLYKLKNGSYVRPEYHPEIVGYRFQRTPEDRAFLEAYNINAPGELWEPMDMPSHGHSWNMSFDKDELADQEEWDEFRRRWYPRLILAESGEFESVWSEYEDAYEDVDLSDWLARVEFVANERRKANNPVLNP